MRALFAALLGLTLAGHAHAQTLRIGIASDPDVLDPTLSRSVAARQVFMAMCDKLIEVDEQGALVPQLATAWEWQEGGRALLLTLRPGVTFHDGVALDAAAAVAGLNRHISAQGSTRRGELGPVTAVEEAGPMQIRIRLSEPFAPLLAALSDRAGMLVSPRQADVLGADFQKEPACAGPYRLTRRVPQDRIELERFPGYWNAGALHFDRVVYRPIPDTTVRAANLRSGTLDVIERVNPSDVGTLRQDRRVRLLEGPSLASVYIAINVAHGAGAQNPLGQDPRVRQALELAIDRNALNQVAFEGLYRPGNQSTPPGHPHHIAALPVPARDLARARALLREAGQERVRVKFSVPNTTEYIQAAEVIQAMAAEAGIALEIQVIEVATLLRAWTAGDFEALIIAWSGRTDVDGNLWGFNACGQSLNGGRYCSEQADAALREGRTSVDPAARLAAYGRAMQVLLRDRPYIYLWHPQSFFGTTAAVSGLRLIPDGLIRVQGLRGG
ncbi:ABC transporter substrate-binding protein [Falsiroseomonas tokyonensis]|uniref:ABC transporter substrate-binding protein n=1 Tax=Falsiroseomonas tokyonensis TaxID=430521 RepID=A0ABV7BY96_9PROT|nr:ABC transporter substrate-binding protein [Falsiroseomonas tokyonensis]MBU8540610.1 ABC transporter substrate-binding protein [Falsiroseomonas tokyonensis]